jgi:NADPH-dependent curcumin reductase CurA
VTVGRTYDPCMATSREIQLAARPSGEPQESDFALVEVDVAEPADGQVLIRNAYMSVDPYMRGRMNDVRSYVPPFQLGTTLDGGAVGQVVASRNDRFEEGAWVVHNLGWRELALSDGRGLFAFDPAVAPISTGLGVLGMPGLTAYVGLLDIGRPRAGETVFVSGAAGAVGSAVGQIAKLKGCRVIGSAGSAEKVAWLGDLGFDEAFDYNEVPARDVLADGIDLYFDNVGGSMLEAAISALRKHGRVVACGAVADRRIHRLRPHRPDAGLPRGNGAVDTRRQRPLPRDGRRGDRERSRGVHRSSGRREHRQDARQDRARAVTWRCRVLGHKVPKARWFFLTERFQRCERCGERVSAK